MKRRDFIKQSTKITGTALIASQIPGCLSYDDLFYPSLFNGKTWSNYQALNISSGTGYDSSGQDAPKVIKEGSTYKMWYIGINATRQIMYCESSDGKSWSNYKLAMANNQYPGSTQSTYPAILKDNGVYHMWVSSFNSPNYNIVHWQSNDGITWTNFFLSVPNNKVPGVDTDYSLAPSVIKDDSTYKMWYAGFDLGSNKTQIVYCESSNGINWSNFQLAVKNGSFPGYDDTNATSPTVIKDGSTYKMWYNGSNTASTYQIIYCESTNGINWSNFQVSVPYNAYQGDTGSYNPFVLNDYGVGKMWFTNTTSIRYAESY